MSLGLVFSGVADGARTHDNRNHNPGLYQLSYSHRKNKIIAERIKLSGHQAGVLAFSAVGLATKISAFMTDFNSAKYANVSAAPQSCVNCCCACFIKA